jgi:hypothetical protein
MLNLGLRVVSFEKIRRPLGLEVKDCLVNAREMPCRDIGVTKTEQSADNAIDDELCEYDTAALPSASIGISCGSVEGVVFGTISGCQVCQCQIGIVSRDASSMVIHSCTVRACVDGGMVLRDGSCSVVSSCHIANSGTGLVLQGISGGGTDMLTFVNCGVGILVHRPCSGTLKNIEIRGCNRGLVVAKGGSGLEMNRIIVDGGRTGVVVGAACSLSRVEAENCEEEGFLVERTSRLVLKDCRAVKCGTGCRVLGDLTCHDCAWSECDAGFIRYCLQSNFF